MLCRLVEPNRIHIHLQSVPGLSDVPHLTQELTIAMSDTVSSMEMSRFSSTSETGGDMTTPITSRDSLDASWGGSGLCNRDEVSSAFSLFHHNVYEEALCP